MKFGIKTVFKFLEKHEVVIFILLFVAILRIPSLFEPNRYADEDIYLTLGQALRKGLVFYRDIHDNKPPLIYITAALAGNIMSFKLILMIWNLITVSLVYKLTKKLLGSAGVVIAVTLAFGILTSIPLLEGNVVNAEMFMIMPTTWAILLLLSARPKYFLVGILFSFAFLYKVPVIFELMMILLWLGIYKAKSLAEALRGLSGRQVRLVAAGFLMPVSLSVGYYYLVGAGEPYVLAALLQNVGYLSSWGQAGTPFFQNGLFLRGILLTGVISYLLLVRDRLGQNFVLVAMWFSGALFGAMLSGRPYPHYLIQLVGPMVIMIGLAVKSHKILLRMITIGLLALLAFYIQHYGFWYYQSVPYYKNFLEYAILNNSKANYDNFYGREVARNQKIADYIRAETTVTEGLFVLGNEPAIYVLADRLPVGRYTVMYHINDFGGEEETYKELITAPPKYFVTFENQGNNYSKLLGFLTASYIKVLKVDDGQIWIRKSEL